MKLFDICSWIWPLWLLEKMLDDSGSKRYQYIDLFEPEASKIFSNNLGTASKCVADW